MKTIYKYELPTHQRIVLPENYVVLSVGMQRDTTYLWCLVDPASNKKEVQFSIYGTGWDMPNDPGKYIGTYFDGSFVWHVFEK